MRAPLTDAAKFPLKAVAWSLGLFGLLRSSVVEQGFVLPLTRFQQTAAEFYAGQPTAPILVTADCSGTDTLALCLAAILAWPATLRARLAGCVGGAMLILGLNTFRIGSLGRAADQAALFEALHLQIWPMILVLASAGYVFLWMRSSGGRGTLASPAARRFAMLAALCLTIFAFCGPWIARSETLLAAGAWTAGEAALLLTTVGVAASASGNIIATGRGAFMVTPECLATALFPLYVAGIFAAPLRPMVRAIALFAAPPLFALLAIARLLLLALPQSLVDSPLFLVHGFHQFVLGVAFVALVAWGHETAGPERNVRATRRSALAIAVALLGALLAGPLLTSGVTLTTRMFLPMSEPILAAFASSGDSQGALATLITFQAALLLALGIAQRANLNRILMASGALFIIQTGFMAILTVGASRFGSIPHALLLRAWAVALPVVLAMALLRPAPRRESPQPFAVAHDPA